MDVLESPISMLRLIRFLLWTFGLYFLFRMGYPDGHDPIYYMVAPIGLLGFAVGCFFIHKLLEISSVGAHTAFEALFIATVFLFVGFTLPQNSRVPPLKKLWDEGRPTRASASLGLSKLGLDPGSRPAHFILKIFP